MTHLAAAAILSMWSSLGTVAWQRRLLSCPVSLFTHSIMFVAQPGPARVVQNQQAEQTRQAVESCCCSYSLPHWTSAGMTARDSVFLTLKRGTLPLCPHVVKCRAKRALAA